jgi:hypothetical protein
MPKNILLKNQRVMIIIRLESQGFGTRGEAEVEWINTWG